MTDTWVDGNAMAGVLREIFTVDMTNASGRCGNCGMTGPIGETQVYEQAAGMVARCRNCDNVLMRVVTAPDRIFLDMHGLSFVELRQPEMPDAPPIPLT